MDAWDREAKAEAEATAAAESLQMIYRSSRQSAYESGGNLAQSSFEDEQHSVVNMMTTGGGEGAFLSVQDLIQAAIQANGLHASASLREIYAFCENKTLLYKRSARSRLLSENKHYKSQIRHALYKAGRFVRNADNPDLWEVEKKWRGQRVKQHQPVAATEKEDNPTTATSLGLGQRKTRAERRGQRQAYPQSKPSGVIDIPVSTTPNPAVVAQTPEGSEMQSSSTRVNATSLNESAANVSRVATPQPIQYPPL
ncbi:hypothetical protein HOP50_12g67450 [Chloropicon primus]|uniref:Uncharacterized protein n=2 Tax=Chloropicon primus TaxID=1764295 RepID=A0A5B8MTU6_9CHLO|nr:hypothetical protein A3770_12p67260 [Chloropicon primus]UPR03416.1 hypothetical protein HOP50_12g67450 [Chloropicon primus]|eukprot:QDZ24208.1 hypothetical protein A3770_12p67260 [Chloropicon primus]